MKLIVTIGNSSPAAPDFVHSGQVKARLEFSEQGHCTAAAFLVSTGKSITQHEGYQPGRQHVCFLGMVADVLQYDLAICPYSTSPGTQKDLGGFLCLTAFTYSTPASMPCTTPRT